MRTLRTSLLATFALTTTACDKPDERSTEAAAKADGAKPDKPVDKPTAEPTAAEGTITTGLTIAEGKSGIEDGFLHIYGELNNGTDKWLSARINVDLLDGGGKEIGVDSILTGVAQDLGTAPQEFVVVEGDVIPPGETSPFHYIRDVNKIGGTYAKHVLATEAREVVKVGRGEITDLTSTFEFGTFEVKGTFKSVGEHTCEDPSPIAALYDAQGKLVSVASIAPTNPDDSFVEKLDKDQSVSFTFLVRGEQTNTLKTFARCEEPD